MGISWSQGKPSRPKKIWKTKNLPRYWYGDSRCTSWQRKLWTSSKHLERFCYQSLWKNGKGQIFRRWDILLVWASKPQYPAELRYRASKWWSHTKNSHTFVSSARSQVTWVYKPADIWQFVWRLEFKEKINGLFQELYLNSNEISMLCL